MLNEIFKSVENINIQKNANPDKKLVIIGGGIVGAIEAYFGYLEAKKNGKRLRVTIYDKNKNIADTTVSHLVPGLTYGEIFSVPRSKELLNLLTIPFDQSDGLSVSDVTEIHQSAVAAEFIEQVKKFGNDEEGYQIRNQILLELGKKSMKLWGEIYEKADEELKKILEDSNFNPCRESTTGQLHDGYRIDLIYGIQNADVKANEIKDRCKKLGYERCEVLLPKAVMEKDLFLKNFCESNSIINSYGELEWQNTVSAIWRPGGCIDTQIFLPKFYDYLQKIMGEYENEAKKTKNCFQLRHEKNVSGVISTNEQESPLITGLKFFDKPQEIKKNKTSYKSTHYVFCPGEAAGTLRKFGFKEPAYSKFPGVSFMLKIPVSLLSNENLEKLSNLNQHMNIIKDGKGFSWQARLKDKSIFVGIAGAKAFYGDQEPHKNHEFATKINLLQLNIINEIFPELISLSLKKETKGKKLEMEDLNRLVELQMAECWVGNRSVSYDGFPTLGAVYNENGKQVTNAHTTTHLGSGGASFSPALVKISQDLVNKKIESDLLNHEEYQKVSQYSDSRRKFF